MSSLVRDIARTLQLDAVAGQAIRALEDQGVRVILIKGPSAVHYLYAADPHTRTYSDVDLVVSPDDFERAQQVLARAGFARQRPLDSAGAAVITEVPLRHVRSGAWIDLHQGFHAVIDFGRWWSLLAANTRTLTVGGVTAEIPDPAGAALIAVLHDMSIVRTETTVEDCRRAVLVFDDETWLEASRRAKDIRCFDTFALELASIPDAKDLVERLGIVGSYPLMTRLRGMVKYDNSLTLGYAMTIAERLQMERGLWPRVRVFLYYLFPPAEALKLRYEFAGRSRTGLAFARVLRPVSAVFLAPWVLWHVLRAARQRR